MFIIYLRIIFLLRKLAYLVIIIYYFYYLCAFFVIFILLEAIIHGLVCVLKFEGDDTVKHNMMMMSRFKINRDCGGAGC